jgi:type II secretory pathway component PulM
MAQHQKMMEEMKAMDARLDGLVQKMNAAQGQAKTDATAATVTELVQQRKTMHERMMSMHQGMMGHMMGHMAEGKESMAACPMMKMMHR